jgi:DNA-binding response OmpR family regulator
MAVLVVEDEQRVRSSIHRGFADAGFSVREASRGDQVLALLASESFEFALLNLKMPGTEGLEVLQKLRARGDMTPVLMVSTKENVHERIATLNAGADDYVAKPFGFEELLARVRAVLRRTRPRPLPVLNYGDLSLDPAARKVIRAGKEIRLTVREFALLQLLLAHAGEVLPRKHLAKVVWSYDAEPLSNVVEVYIRYLRMKVDAPFASRLIHTVRGTGYVLRSDS